jgi:hypothetical protein
VDALEPLAGEEASGAIAELDAGQLRDPAGVLPAVERLVEVAERRE